MSQSGQKTERPTEKRLRDARRKGQVAKSHDLTGSLLLLAAILVLWFGGKMMGGNLAEAMRGQLAEAATFRGQLDKAAALAALFGGLKTIAASLLPFFAVLLFGALLVSYLQVGPIFSFETVKPNLNKLNPAEGLKQKFLKSRPYIELLKTLIKIAVTGAVVGAVLWSSRSDLILLTHQSPPRVAAFTVDLIVRIGVKVGLAFVAIGVGDYILQRMLHLRELKMSKHEVREEYKETEGNPAYKSLRRQRHREILTQNMLAAVRRAQVVVANPTHVSVALEYQRESMSAPVVVAKGAELMAAQIREIAREANVPIIRDVPLARALYELEIDGEIPDELYEAVAVVLRWVYEMAEERGEVVKYG